MEKKHDTALIIFSRRPVLGKVKTRLASDIGEAKALIIYKLLLNHTRTISNKLNCDLLLFYSDGVDYDDEWDGNLYQKFEQRGDDLGIKMYNAFKFAFYRNYNKVVIIGSDCHDLTQTIIEQAFDALNNEEVVIGPAKDGGYYLLGLKRLIKPLFWNKEWSSENVLVDTILDLKNENKSYVILETLNDIDHAEDLGILKGKI